jgi:hypothetical protein
MQNQGSEQHRTPQSQEEGDLRWSTRARCLAVLRELDAPLPDYETIACLLHGAAEDIEKATR